MDINLWTVLAASVLAMLLGALWYGPLFGKAWLHAIGATEQDLAARKEMQRKALPLYLVQFLLVLFQAFVLALFIKGSAEVSGVVSGVLIWAAFVMPTLAGSSMWTNDSSRVKWTRFGIQASYQLVVFVMFGLMFFLWA